MTATTSFKQPGLDPESTHRDPANQPERPGTIPWELLGARDYRVALTDLGSWLAWLVPTYRIPPSVIPPCWFLHPGLIEELGHLWTGWRVTRHPDSGLGMVGLEWDGHRERATGRLRELVATAGCNGTSHSTKPGPLLNRDDRLWEATLQSETTVRTARSGEQAARSAAQAVLLKAERREELAVDILRNIVAKPAHPRAAELEYAEIALDDVLRVAASDAPMRGREARIYIETAGLEASLNLEVAAAREALIAWIVSGCDAAQISRAANRWIASVTRATPAHEALRRTIAANTGKSAAATHEAVSAVRHPGIARLLPPGAP